ncbi:ABC transporter permease subunit [Thalassobaculum sp.]|uniref:ABC transporter permease subunit n=1 Tax=Thalassobaculum sp. TaxID=2022740 RepID=UPI0032EB4652
MSDLIRIYGKSLTTIFLGLTALWIVALIVVPQLRMIERAFVVDRYSDEAARVGVEIDRSYTRVFTIDQELERAAAGPATPTAPSPFSPSPSPAKPSAPSPFATPSASSTGAVSGDPDRTAALKAEKAELQARIAELEVREKEIKAGGTGYALGNFTSMSAIHAKIFLSTLMYALCVTILAFLACYPVAYAVATSRSSERVALLMLGLVIPYAINELLRIFSWIMILEKHGVLNRLLDSLGLIDLAAGEGMRFVASNGAVFAVMVYAYILFMVFPIYNTIETLDRNQIEAARDLGASTWRIHWRVVLPHAKPGIAVGAVMTFMLSAGSIAAPEIVGRGLHPDWFSQVIYQRFFESNNWNQGSAYALVLLVACVVFVLGVMGLFKVGIRDIAK